MNLPPAFSCSARQDWRPWACLVLGNGFAGMAVYASRPAACAAGAECSPWLSAAGLLIGLGFAAAGAAALWRNASRGSCFDPVSGELHWWQHRRRGAAGLGGSIDPVRIARIRLIHKTDTADEIHLFDTDGQRLAHFDSEVVPWDHQQWAAQLCASFPHIALEKA